MTKRHAFVGKTYTDLLIDEQGNIVHSPGMPVVAQVKGEPKGALAQVCDVCGETAGADGRVTDHQED